MAEKENKNILDEFLENCDKENLDEVAVFAINSKDRSQVATCMRAEKLSTAMAMIGMLIKILAEDVGVESTKIAEDIRDNLEKAEQKMEEFLKEKEKKEKKTIHIKITESE